MKTLLIRPPATYPEGALAPSANTPIGLLSIAAVLEKHGFPTMIMDGLINPDRPQIKEKNDVLHFGKDWEDISEQAANANADLVGISAPFSAQFPNSILCAEIVRKALPGAFVVMGGNHPTVRPADCFNGTSAVDMVCLGEGEETMVEIARRRSTGEDLYNIPGTAVRDGSSFRVNQPRERLIDLDSLPFPAYHLIDLEQYFKMHERGFTDRVAIRYPGSERTVSLVTSRGCPFNCVFCSIHLHMGRKWRCHSAEYVRRHIDHLVSEYRIRHIHFEDDNISAHPVRFRRILEDLRCRHPKVTWDTPNGIRADTLDRELVGLCKESGCTYLIFGIESGSTRVLREVIDKKLDLDAVTEVARWCAEACLNAMAFYVVGFPGESIEEMKSTANYAVELMRRFDVHPFLFVATPLPGTRLEKICLDRGFLKAPLQPADLARMTQGKTCVETDSFTMEDVAEVTENFTRQVGVTFIRNSARFFGKHPEVLPRFFRETAWLSRHFPLKEAAHRVLEFKRCLL